MKVVSLSLSPTHTFTKTAVDRITLIEGIGVEGDAHSGVTVKHRSRVAKDPTQPNLRQVYFLHEELHDELRQQGFDIAPGQIGENILTRGIDLLSLPVNTILKIGDETVVKITGLRNPCKQLDDNAPGLLNAVLDREDDGTLILKAGIMGIVLQGGEIVLNDTIQVELPPEPHQPLERV